jgi:hypothetical protein
VVEVVAPQASAAALMAPAEVPVMTGKGLPVPVTAGPAARRISAMASSTPTW